MRPSRRCAARARWGGARRTGVCGSCELQRLSGGGEPPRGAQLRGGGGDPVHDGAGHVARPGASAERRRVGAGARIRTSEAHGDHRRDRGGAARTSGRGAHASRAGAATEGCASHRELARDAVHPTCAARPRAPGTDPPVRGLRRARRVRGACRPRVAGPRRLHRARRNSITTASPFTTHAARRPSWPRQDGCADGSPGTR